MSRKIIQKKALEVMVKVVKKEVEKNENAWPPICAGIFHQPKRPNKRV